MGALTLLPESQQLDRYQLLGEIASGGMASVFLARLAGVGGFQRLVAIKRLHPHLAKEREFVEMFLDEARLAASIHHRNVVPILEIGTTDAGYYLVMEYIEGVTLARLMTQAAALRQPVPQPVLLRLIVDTLSGLHAAHELTDDNKQPLGVVHRDCSPQNILVGLDGCTRITDFGIARASSRLHSTREGAMKGKLAYMAPEQTQGDEFDRRADLWSVAVVLWEVLAERRLFKSKTEAQTLKRLLHDPIPRLTDVDSSISPALASVCQMALERDPDDRFQTAAEMADAIESAAKVAARAEEPVATERTIEAFMKERYGGDVDAQREELRSFLQATPTMVGPRKGRPTDPGWVGPTASEPGVLLPQGEASKREVAVPMGEGWETSSVREPAPAPVVSEERALTEARAMSKTSRSWPAPNLVAAAAEAEALAHDDPAAVEDETAIYDPTSTTGVTADPEHTDWVPQPTNELQASAGLPLVRRRRSALPLAVLLLVSAVGVAAVVAYRSGGRAPETTVDTSPREPAQARTEDRPEPSTATTAGSPPADPTSGASAEPTTSGDRGPLVARPSPPLRPGPAAKPAPGPAPAPAQEPKPEPKPEPSPVPAPPPKPPDLDDLSNPYR